MWTKIIREFLIRYLRTYIDGLSRESVQFDFWNCFLELRDLRLKPEALAMLFENLGLDLPVTVTAGYIGSLSIEVPLKTVLLRNRPALTKILIDDLIIVASPVSDGDQSALELREKRLKAARLAKDETIRDAKFSMTTLNGQIDLASVSTDTQYTSTDPNSSRASIDSQSQGSAQKSTWSNRLIAPRLNTLLDNIEIQVKNVIVQYEDSSSVRERPYTATVAFDSLKACSTDHNWKPCLIDDPISHIMHKSVQMKGFVLNWEPGSNNNTLKSWIKDPNVKREKGQWADLLQGSNRHAIRPMDGELRIAITKMSSLALAISGKDPSLEILKSIPKVKMDLHFSDVEIALDDFQYHTLLSTVMYLSDIDRQARPTTPKGRWLWALDRLLPRFKSRRDAILRFTNEGIQQRGEKRIQYCKARNKIVTARRKGLAEPKAETKIVQKLEEELSFDDIIYFRDASDRMLLVEAEQQEPGTLSRNPLFGLFYRYSSVQTSTAISRSSRTDSGRSTPRRSRSRDSLGSESRTHGQTIEPTRTFETNDQWNNNKTTSIDEFEAATKTRITVSDDSRTRFEEANVPSFRMGFLLGRGAIQLKEGGFPNEPIPFANLEFRDLRFGIETGGKDGFQLEALLGRFEVVDLKKNIKVMYPRVPWSGEQVDVFDNDSDGWKSASSSLKNVSSDEEDTNSAEIPPSDPEITNNTNDQSTVPTALLESYPHRILEAISDIREGYGFGDNTLPVHTSSLPSGSPYVQGPRGNSSNASLSCLSENEFSTNAFFDREDLSIAPQTPLAYIAALRLKKEEVRDKDWARGARRMAMDLAIGGMEVRVDGQKGAFISSINFWNPREKMPSIMKFLMRAAAPRLASLRMNIQKENMAKSVPMRMDIFIRGPRFVVPGSVQSNLSLVLDLGTFAMETSTGRAHILHPDDKKLHKGNILDSESGGIAIRFTDYRMECSDLGLYVVSEEGKKAAERVIKPFSLHLLLQVLHNPPYVETMTFSWGKLNVPKVKLQCQLPQLRTSLSHRAFRQILDVTKSWQDKSQTKTELSNVNDASPTNFSAMALPSYSVGRNTSNNSNESRPSPLVNFEMNLNFQELQLELRDSSAHRIVTVTSTGTTMQMKKRSDCVDFDFKLLSFRVLDGSRGATAPFRQLAYAGTDEPQKPSSVKDELNDDPFATLDRKAFIVMSYQGDLINHEQTLSVKILSLNLVCVREAYFALANFFYLKATKETSEEEYIDPFLAVGMTTSSAAKALRNQAGRSMEYSKQALANRGQLTVVADLDGLNVTLVSAEGAIACFDVNESKVKLVQSSTGAVTAQGELGGFGIRDLTASFDLYSETIRYNRHVPSSTHTDGDGWQLSIPRSGEGDIWLRARLRNLRIVYLQRFIIILKKYIDVLRESLKPVIHMKGGIGEVFDGDAEVDLNSLQEEQGRVRISLITENIDVVMPRHSQSPYEALRFYVPRSSITNEDLAVPGYKFGFKLLAENVDAFVLYTPPAEGEGRALTNDGTKPTLRHITPTLPLGEIVPFSTNINIAAKIDGWRQRKVPEVILNADGIPVLKDGEEEREYDPSKWLPTIRVRISAPNGISARLCEAEYSILYFTFTENVIERPDIEFTDIVRGLKTPILPTRKPVQPIMFSSNRMPPNYQILFEVPKVESIIMSGADKLDTKANLIRSELRGLMGFFEYGVDYRMTIEVNADVHSLEDIRPSVPTHGMKVIMPTQHVPTTQKLSDQSDGARSDVTDVTRSVTFMWDRPFGFSANVMVVASDLRIIVVPELFRDLGLLTTPGFPYLKSSAPPPLLRFNGRLLILTVSRPEIWLMAGQDPRDGRSLVIRGDVIAKVKWAPVTGRNSLEVSANGIQVNLSSLKPFSTLTSSQTSNLVSETDRLIMLTDRSNEIPILYPSDISLRFEGTGYDPPKRPDDEPIRVPDSRLSVNAEAILIRIDVNDAPLILAVFSRLAQMKPSKLSKRPLQPGRFDEWKHHTEEGDISLVVDFHLPHCRLMFTDEIAGRYVPIMEGRLKHVVLKSKVPLITDVSFELSLDLFNEEKGWWEPGLEVFPLNIAAATAQSGAQQVKISAHKTIEVNITPNTVSGATRVSKALKSAVQELHDATISDQNSEPGNLSEGDHAIQESTKVSQARRPSVASFCVRNETGRGIKLLVSSESRPRDVKHDQETEVEELLWTALSSNRMIAGNPNEGDRKSMTCSLSLSGYRPVTVDAKELGNRLVQFEPEVREPIIADPGHSQSPPRLTLVWSVSMRDGVPFCCIRSLMRIKNCTKVDLEVDTPLSRFITTNRHSHADSSKDYLTIRAGEAWSIPIDSIDEEIRLRPSLSTTAFAYAKKQEIITASGHTKKDSHAYSWSSALGTTNSLYELGRQLLSRSRSRRKGGPSSSAEKATADLISCTGETEMQTFYASIHPIVDPHFTIQKNIPKQPCGWVDVEICTPLVLQNLLPRDMLFRLLNSEQATPNSHMLVSQGVIKSGDEFHIHTTGSDFTRSGIAIAVDNTYGVAGSRCDEKGLEELFADDLHFELPKITKINIGGIRSIPFALGLAHEQSQRTRYIRMYCDFWIRNRSDTDLFLRDHDHPNAPSNTRGPKIYLRGRQPGTKADQYICFSGKWLSFQRTDTTEDVWVSVGTEISEIDKPIPLAFDGLSLLLEVRPGRGKFNKSLIVTIRNAVWIENRTGGNIEWCQPAALNSSQIALSKKVHLVQPGKCVPLHWDFRTRKKAVRIRRVSEEGTSAWIWSSPVTVEGVEGEFPAKMYLPKLQRQYIARVVVSKLSRGVSLVVIHREDRDAPPFKIVNLCTNRAIAFRQSRITEAGRWLVSPLKTIRYSWDDPQAPAKHRSLIVEVILKGQEGLRKSAIADHDAMTLHSEASSSMDILPVTASSEKNEKGTKYPKFSLNIETVDEKVKFSHSDRFHPPLLISVHADGPTKVVTFVDGDERSQESKDQDKTSANDIPSSSNLYEQHQLRNWGINIGIDVFVTGLGISLVETASTELAYLSISRIRFVLDRCHGQQLVTCEVQDLQLDNQLAQCIWPVALWSPPPLITTPRRTRTDAPINQAVPRKPFFQFILDGPYPAVNRGIGTFDGIFVALQQLHIAADEDFALRSWLFAESLIEAAGGTQDRQEPLDGSDIHETGLPESLLSSTSEEISKTQNNATKKDQRSILMSRLSVKKLELCPLKITVSFTSSRTSTAAERIGGFRSLIRTIVAVLGNVENAEFRFNALELQDANDTTSHFGSLITNYYVSQGSNQKMVLLASNSLIGNPSALFESIAKGATDFFVEPANARGSADFIASLGRGSSSLLTNTVGSIAGVIAKIPGTFVKGIEIAVGDREYLAERDAIRGGKARAVSSPFQGTIRGVLSVGHGIASGAAGLVRYPLEGAAEEGPSGFIKGLGKGVIGGVLKPLTGALDMIAEPAAGFQNMMMAQQSNNAEPVRPRRLFVGANSDRLARYNFHEALGQAVLTVINRGDSENMDERLHSWQYLVRIRSNSSNDDITRFLWALLRRSLYSSNFQAKFLQDAQGTPQRAENIRVCLITDRRIIATSLDGQVSWHCALGNIITDNEYPRRTESDLIIKHRSPGRNEEHTIRCGLKSSMDTLYSNLQNAIADYRNNSQGFAENLRHNRKSSDKENPDQNEHTGIVSQEMEDFEASRSTSRGTEMKILSRQRKEPVSLELPGRKLASTTGEDSKEQQNLSHELVTLRNTTKGYPHGSLRCVKIFFVNQTEEILLCIHQSLKLGKWSKAPASTVEPYSAVVFEAYEMADRVTDLSGCVMYAIQSRDETEERTITIRFLNPMLAGNAFGVGCPPEFSLNSAGGEKGDHISSTLTFQSAPTKEKFSSAEYGRKSKLSPEPLLFGRSQVPPHLPPIMTKPPHLERQTRTSPDDPNLVAQLTSLGFSEQDALTALEASDADLSRAYSLLTQEQNLPNSHPTDS